MKEAAGLGLMEGFVMVDLIREMVGVARDRPREAIGLSEKKKLRIRVFHSLFSGPAENLFTILSYSLHIASAINQLKHHNGGK